MMKPIVILGCGGHGRVVADVARACGRSVTGFLDTHTKQGQFVGGLKILGGDACLDDATFVAAHEFVVAIADQQGRRRLVTLVEEKHGVLATLVHPSAVIAPDVRIGDGTVVMAGSVVNPGAVLGSFVIVNTGATVDHDCQLADGVHIAPGAHLAGAVTCGVDAFVGLGALVIQGRRIGARAVVGAGAVVIADVPDGVTVVGCPAAVVRRGRSHRSRHGRTS
jgi:sugar O-acyltransferase (sialic acid O-acetyltransferase NeuD family)